MFAGRVVGRSMEPVIPDGSLCLFRGSVAGSRQNKRLLIQRMGVTDSTAEFTVKKYTSKKVHSGEDEWQNVSILLTPLNPEFEAMKFGPEDEKRQFRVIAEFIQVLEEPLEGPCGEAFATASSSLCSCVTDHGTGRPPPG